MKVRATKSAAGLEEANLKEQRMILDVSIPEPIEGL
jgi:hypothetical protein